PETVKNLRGALWMFVHVKPWVTPAEFDQIFIAELVRRNLRMMVFGEPGSPIPFKSGNPIPAGDLQSAFAKAMADRRQFIEPPEGDNPEPSPFDDEDEQPPPTFSAPPPPPPAVKPPAVTMPKQTAKAIYQSPPPPPPL